MSLPAKDHMGGLYQRARDYLRSHPHLSLVKDRPGGYEGFDGTDEERAQIEREIQEAVDENRLDFHPESLEIPAKKRGTGLPFLVNTVAIVLCVAGGYLLWNVFENEADMLSAQTVAVSSAEGQLLSAMRADTEAQLAAKADQIAQIQERLASLESERGRIQSAAARSLEEQEDALRAEFEADIAAERRRLLGLDLSGDELTQSLEKFRAERQQILDQRIAALRDASAAELAQQEETLDRLLVEVENQLQDAETDRRSIAAAAEAEAAESESARRTAENLLAELEQQQQQRDIVLDQVLGFYGDVQETLQDGDLDAAAETLAGLREYLRTGPIITHPDLKRRREVELFLVQTLEDQLREQQTTATPDTESLVRSAGLVTQVNELVQEAEGVFDSGELARARELYAAALSEIPAVELGLSRIEAIEEAIAQTASDQITAYISEGNQLYRAGEYEQAVEAYSQAMASLPSAEDAVVERLLDAGYQLRATDSTRDLEALRDDLADAEKTQTELSRVTRELESTTEQLERTRSQLATTQTLLEQAQQNSEDDDSASVAAVSRLQERVEEQREMVSAIERYQEVFGQETVDDELPTPLELLETKLVILRMVSSDAVEADFPDLYERLNSYLDDLVAQQRAEASEEMLTEVNRLLAEISSASESSISQIQAEYPALASTAGSNTTQDFFESLRRVTDLDEQER